MRNAEFTVLEPDFVPCAVAAAHPYGLRSLGAGRPGGGGGLREQGGGDQRVQGVDGEAAGAQQVEVGLGLPDVLGQQRGGGGRVAFDGAGAQRGVGTGAGRLEQQVPAPVDRNAEGVDRAVGGEASAFAGEAAQVEPGPGEHLRRGGLVVRADALRLRRVELDARRVEGPDRIATGVEDGRPLGAGGRIGGSGVLGGEFAGGEGVPSAWKNGSRAAPPVCRSRSSAVCRASQRWRARVQSSAPRADSAPNGAQRRLRRCGPSVIGVVAMWKVSVFA